MVKVELLATPGATGSMVRALLATPKCLMLFVISPGGLQMWALFATPKWLILLVIFPCLKTLGGCHREVGCLQPRGRPAQVPHRSERV